MCCPDRHSPSRSLSPPLLYNSGGSRRSERDIFAHSLHFFGFFLFFPPSHTFVYCRPSLFTTTIFLFLEPNDDNNVNSNKFSSTSYILIRSSITQTSCTTSSSFQSTIQCKRISSTCVLFQSSSTKHCRYPLATTSS